MAGGRESTALGVGQPKAPPTQVLLKDAVLLPQVVDDIVLMPIHPVRERHEENPQPHGVDHGPSLFGWSSAARRGARLNFRIVRGLDDEVCYLLLRVPRDTGVIEQRRSGVFRGSPELNVGAVPTL